jgi:hypothetical protein
MHLPISRLSLPFRLALVVLTLGVFAACDRHDAVEVPKDYGHGSGNTEKSYRNHDIDSKKGSRSFSDTAGVDTDQKKETGEHH